MELVKGDQVFWGLTSVPRYCRRLPKDLVSEEDESQRLIEVISAEELCLMPPKSLPVMFRRQEKVDTFDKDGWWVGEVIGRRGDLYSVYFATTSEELEYPLYCLRKHLEWVNGDWVSSAGRQQ